jgi:putative sugar O-methyltransferase
MGEYSIARIEQSMSAIKAYIDAEMAQASDSILGRISQFWQVEFAARPNYPSTSDFLAFRREGFTHGMADGFSFDLKEAHQYNLDREKAHARSVYEIFRQSAAPDRIAAIDEAALGAPLVFEHHGANRSASFWTNAVTALRVKDILESRAPANRPLDILEIGAGWGCMAHQLHQILDVGSYTIVDLPQNLFLSSTYVSASFGLKLLFARGGAAPVSTKPKSLLCAVPEAVPAIAQKYDVVVNTFSLQEMDLDTAQGYFAWVGQALTENGIFLSFNSHGKAGIRIPSDYPMEHFHLEHLGMFRDYPSGLMNTIPYEMVLSRRGGGPVNDPALLNVICSLIQFGLGDDLKEICRQFCSHTLPPDMMQALQALSGYFSLSSERRAAALAETASSLPAALHAYLLGMDAFVKSNAQTARVAFEKAMDSGLKGFARLRASAHLAILTGKKTLPKWNVDFDARLAYPELAQMLDNANTSQFIGQFERIVSVELLSQSTA